MSDEMRDELGGRVVSAWLNEGPSPSYHRDQKARLKAEWPTLYWALVDFVEHGAATQHG